jgi:hypothetical protein
VLSPEILATLVAEVRRIEAITDTDRGEL